MSTPRNGDGLSRGPGNPSRTRARQRRRLDRQAALRSEHDGRLLDPVDATTASSNGGPPRPRRRVRHVVTGLLAGILAAGAVGVLGVYLEQARPTTWTAQSHMLMAPTVQDKGSETSAYYETLSNGQLPATAAAIVSERRFLVDAERALDLPDRKGISVQVAVLPETAVLKIEVTAPDVQIAESVADELPRQATSTVDQLLAPYQLTVLGSADGTAIRASLGRGQWLALTALAALAAGLLVQQVVLQLVRSRRRPRGTDRS